MLKPDDTGLLVVDVQGKLAQIVHDSEALLANLHALISGAKVLGLPILWLEQNPDGLGPTAPALRALLTPAEPIPKYTFDACQAPTFSSAAEQAGVSTWLVCGIEAHICVYQTSRSLLERNYRVEIVSDGVSSRSKVNKAVALSRLAALGAGITSVEMCLYELVGDCRAEAFREILALVK